MRKRHLYPPPGSVVKTISQINEEALHGKRIPRNAQQIHWETDLTYEALATYINAISGKSYSTNSMHHIACVVNCDYCDYLFDRISELKLKSTPFKQDFFITMFVRVYVNE
jgi:hypothetical protein